MIYSTDEDLKKREQTINLLAKKGGKKKKKANDQMTYKAKKFKGDVEEINRDCDSNHQDSIKNYQK